MFGLGGGAWLTHQASTRRRPQDLLAAIAAPVAIVAGLIGALWLLVPGFL